MKILSNNWSVLYEDEKDTIRGTVEAAVEKGICLREANLSGDHLREARIGGVDLSYANLNTIDLRFAYMKEADLREADLREAEVGEAILIGADLRYANMAGANFYGADLSLTALHEAYITGATLAGAKLDRVNISGAKIDMRAGAIATVGPGNAIWQFGPIGSRNDFLVAINTDLGLLLSIGCQHHLTVDEFLNEVDKTHGSSHHAKAYRAAVQLMVAMAEVSQCPCCGCHSFSGQTGKPDGGTK